MKKIFIAMLLVLALSVSVFAGSFSDVSSDHWAYQAVTKLVDSGILSGYPDGTFKGQNNLSRYEIAVVVSRVLDEIEAEQVALADEVEDAADNLSVSEAQEVNEIVKAIVAENTGEELSNEEADEVRSIVQALTFEFRAELKELGANVDALAVDVDKLDDRLTTVESKVKNIKEPQEPNISFSAWGRAIFAPGIESDDGDSVPVQATSWGGNNARIGWTMKGESASGNIGIHVDLNTDGGESGHQDQQKIWAKPFQNLTFEVGPSVFYGALRGDAAYGAWNWLRFAEQDDEDAIFVRGKAGGGDQNSLHQNGNGIQGGWDRDDGVYAGSIVHYDNDQFHAFAALDQSHGSLIQEEYDDIPEVREDYTTSMMYSARSIWFWV